MRHRTAEEVREKVCGSKVRHPSIVVARRHAEQLNRQHPGQHYSHYPCPFADGDGHWHAGHVPSLESLEAIARVIRGLDPNPPVPHEVCR